MSKKIRYPSPSPSVYQTPSFWLTMGRGGVFFVDIKTGDNKEKLDALLTKCQAKHKQNGSKYIGKR